MSVKAHPDLRELLQFAFTGEEDDRKQVLDELKEYNQSVKDALLAVYSADEMQVIIEEVLERIADRALKELDERIELDLVTFLSFILGSFPNFLHTNGALFDTTFGILVSILRRTKSEHTQTQCFVLIRTHLVVIASITYVDVRVKLARMQTILRAFDISVRPNSISYIEKLRAHLNAIEVCAQLLNELHANNANTATPVQASQPRASDESSTRLERFTLIIQSICELFASVFAREPSELQNTHLNDDVQVAKRCIHRAHEALFKLQEVDLASEPPVDSAVITATLPTHSYTNTLVFCMANQERVAVTHRLFQLLERLLSGATTSDYSRFIRSRMLYLAMCAIWPFALVTLTSSSDPRFNRSLASSALLAFRAFVLLLERSFAAVRDAMRLRAAGTPLACAPSHAAHVRCVQSVLRVIDLTMRRSLIESDVAVQMMHTLLCSLSVESLFTRLSLDPPFPCLAKTGASSDALEEDTKPSILMTQYQPASEGVSLSHTSRIKPGERFLNEIVVSLLFHICIANSSNDAVERPRVICDFFSRLTSVVRCAAASGEMERVPLANVLRFGELMVVIVNNRVNDYEKELQEHLSTADFVDRKVFYCAALVQLWTAISSFFFAALTRPTVSDPNQLTVDTNSGVDTGSQSFRLNFGLENCEVDLLNRTNGLLARVLDTGLRLCRTVIENEPMGVKRESLFDQVITSFDNTFERLCSVYERLFEDNSTLLTDNGRDLLAYLEGNNGEAQSQSLAAKVRSRNLTAPINATHLSEPTAAPADSRPACYRVRLEFDLLRVDLNNLKSVITKVHSNPFLSNGKWCDVKPRRTRRHHRSGFPKPRPKSKQRCFTSSMSLKPAAAKPADKYTRFARQVHVGRGQYSKPRLAGLTPVLQSRSTAAPSTLALRSLSAPCASDSSLEERCPPLVSADAELESDQHSSLTSCLLISAPPPTSTSLSSCDAPTTGKEDEPQASPYNNDAESYTSALDVFGADLTEVDEVDTAALLHNFIQNFDVDTTLPLQPSVDCPAIANTDSSLEVLTDNQVSPRCNQMVVEVDDNQMPIAAIGETETLPVSPMQPASISRPSELDTTEISEAGSLPDVRTISDTRLAQNQQDRQESIQINNAEPITRAVEDEYEVLD